MLKTSNTKRSKQSAIANPTKSGVLSFWMNSHIHELRCSLFVHWPVPSGSTMHQGDGVLQLVSYFLAKMLNCAPKQRSNETRQLEPQCRKKKIGQKETKQQKKRKFKLLRKYKEK